MFVCEILDSRAISPWPIGPRTLSPWHIKSQGPKGRGPNVPRTSGPWPQGPSELRCQGLKVRGPKVRGPMGQGLFSLFFVAFGTVLIQAYIYRCHIIPPWFNLIGGDSVTPLYVSESTKKKSLIDISR